MAPLFPAAVAAEDFQIGQLVRWYVSERQISPYVGKVVAVNPSVQKVEVVFPVGGKQQRSPEELIPITMFADMSSNVGPSSMQSNFYTSYQDDQNMDYSVKGVSGLYKKVASNYFNQKISPLLDSVTAYFNYGLSRKEASEKLFKKYANDFGEGAIYHSLNLIYMKTASTAVDYDSIIAIVQDALAEDEDEKRQNKIKDAFAIAFNGTGANVFVKVDDLLGEAFECYEEEGIISAMRRAVGRAGGDIKSLINKKDSDKEEKSSEERY